MYVVADHAPTAGHDYPCRPCIHLIQDRSSSFISCRPHVFPFLQGYGLSFKTRMTKLALKMISRAIPPYSLHYILPLPSLADATLISFIGKMNTYVRFWDDYHFSHPQHCLALPNRSKRQRENPSFVPAIKCRKEAIKQLIDMK